MREGLSQYTARVLGLTGEQEEIFAYGLALLRSNLLSLAAVAAAGLIVDRVGEVFLISLVVALLRAFGGGAHCETEYRCAVTSAVIFGGLGFVAPRLAGRVSPGYFEALAALAILTATYLWAPLPSPQKPIRLPEHKRKLRRLSLGAIALLAGAMAWLSHAHYIRLAACIALGFAWQAVLLSPLGSRIIMGFDRALSGIANSLFPCRPVNKP
jgi:accessory gene regulator B